MNIDLLSLPLPSYDAILERRPSFFEEAVSAGDAAGMMGKSIAALAQMRCRRIGPAFVKVGGSVMYRRRDVIEWLRDHVQPTADSRSAAQ